MIAIAAILLFTVVGVTAVVVAMFRVSQGIARYDPAAAEEEYDATILCDERQWR